MADIKNIADLCAELGTIERLLKRDLYKYTACGAWIEWDEHGVRIGSIVEGADAEVSPVSLNFPFTMDDYDEAIEYVESEADRIWLEWHDCDEAECN